MSATQPKDTALKTKELAVEAAPVVVPPPPPPTAKALTTATTATGRKTLTSSAALSLFDQLKNSVNLNSLTIGAGNNSNPEATPPTATATAVATPTTPATPPPPSPSPSPSSNIELKPPAKPARPFSTPSSIGIVQGTKRGAGGVVGGSSGAQPAKLDINALRSQLYQGARKTATTATRVGTGKTSTVVATANRATGGERGTKGSKKRCLDRYDSSESSDR